MGKPARSGFEGGKVKRIRKTRYRSDSVPDLHAPEDNETTPQ